MNQDTVKIQLSGVSQTLLGQLWFRAQLSKKYSRYFMTPRQLISLEKLTLIFHFLLVRLTARLLRGCHYNSCLA